MRKLLAGYECVGLGGAEHKDRPVTVKVQELRRYILRPSNGMPPRHEASIARVA